MAKQFGTNPLRGSIGDVTYYKNDFGYQAKAKGGPTREQVLTHEKFINARRNATEFKMAVRDATLIRQAMGNLLMPVKNVRLSYRMNKLLLEVAKSDPVHDWGERVAAAGDVHLLAGFNFNDKLSFADVLAIEYHTEADNVREKMQVVVPPFIPKPNDKYPEGATHFRFVSLGAVIDLEKQHFVNAKRETVLLPIGHEPTTVICLEHGVAAMPDAKDSFGVSLLLHVFGMIFYTVEGNKEKMLKGGALMITDAGLIK